MFVGRIAQEKSIEIPIEGFRYVSDAKIKLMIVGGGPQLEELQKLVQRYHLEQQVIFTDKKLPEEIPAYYACADCFVSASLTETQGMTYIEALACGLPVFARYDDVLKDLVIEEDLSLIHIWIRSMELWTICTRRIPGQSAAPFFMSMMSVWLLSIFQSVISCTRMWKGLAAGYIIG